MSYARISSEVSRRVADGRLRKLATRLYTRNLRDAPRDIVRRNLWAIVAGYFPDALVADRTALELEPARDGSVCVVSPRGADVELPGIVLRPRRGTPPHHDDQRFMNQRLYLSSPARAYLDNLCRSRTRRGRLPRTLPRTDIEERLERLIASAGVDACNRLRDDARRIADDVGRSAQRVELEAIIGAMAGTGDARLTARSAQARARGRPYDGARVALFEDLFSALRETPAATRRPRPRDGIGNAILAFFEAYFSNYHRRHGVRSRRGGRNRFRRPHSAPAAGGRARHSGRLARRLRSIRDAPNTGDRRGVGRPAPQPPCHRARRAAGSDTGDDSRRHRIASVP